MSEFLENLKVDIVEDSDEELKQKAIDNYIKNEQKKFQSLYEIPEIREYFNRLISAILLSQNKRFGDNEFTIHYRFKSPKSISSKIKKYVEQGVVECDPKTKEFNVTARPLLDTFAIRIIAGKRPSLFFSKDKDIQKMIEEKKENYKFLEQMQEFKSRLIEDEYIKPKMIHKQTNVTQVEYFENCIKVLNRTKSLIDPQETDVINLFNEKIYNLERNVSFLKAANLTKQLITPDVFENKETNFIDILNNFERKMHNNLDLKMLNKQVNSLFNNNDIFIKLGVSKSSTLPTKQKRTSSGYESDFIYLDTLFGPIECQLQTEDQYERNQNDPLQAHATMPGKEVVPLQFPDLKDPKSIAQYKKEVDYISPKKSTARIVDKNNASIEQYGAYRNYCSIANEIPENDPSIMAIHSYFEALYLIRNKIFKDDPDQLIQFNNYDIDQYVQSKEFKKVLELSDLWNKDSEKFLKEFDNYKNSEEKEIE